MRVRHISHRRPGISDEEFRAFNKRPLSQVSDEELLRYYAPGMVYVNCDENGVAYPTLADQDVAKRRDMEREAALQRARKEAHEQWQQQLANDE